MQLLCLDLYLICNANFESLVSQISCADIVSELLSNQSWCLL